MAGLSERQVRILEVVQSRGEKDARVLDMAISALHGPGEISVRNELVVLADLGLLEVDETKPNGGTWRLTTSGRDLLKQYSSGSST